MKKTHFFYFEEVTSLMAALMTFMSGLSDERMYVPLSFGPNS